MIILIGYPSCSTCKRVEKQLKILNIDYVYRDVTQDTPSGEELLDYFERSGESSLKKLINTSGVMYREENYKDKLKGLTPKETFEKVSENGMLIKRPILVTDYKVYIGKNIQKYIEEIQSKKGE